MRNTAAVPRKASHRRRNVGIGLLVIAIVIVVAFNLPPPQGGSRPANVVVKGFAVATGDYTYVSGIQFTSDTGRVYSYSMKTVNGSVSDLYSVSLPNDHTYSVQLNLTDTRGGFPVCNEGNFTLNQGPGGGVLTEDWTC